MVVPHKVAVHQIGCGCLLEETKKTRQLLTAECILTFSVYGMIINKKLGVKFINYHQQKKNHS